MKPAHVLALLVIIATGSACNENAIVNYALTPNGIWQQVGYGNIIAVNDTIISVYNVTERNCVLSTQEEILDLGRIERYTKDTLTIKHGIDEWQFTRLERLPETCQAPVELSNDPKLNFQVFWDTFNEQYASFDLKQVDWKKVYEAYEPKVSKITTDLELYTIFQEMIALLNDGHVKMDVPETLEDAYVPPTKSVKERYSKLDEFQLSENIAALYVDSLHSYNAGILRYGRINDHIGYIQINSMFLLADYGLPQDLDLREFYGQYWEHAKNRKDEIQRQDEVDGIHFILNSIIHELAGVSSYILDLRFNGGGKDGAALAVLEHFSDKANVVFTKKARSGNGYTAKQAIRIVPSKERFIGPTYLLTSNRTASAAEILVLASLSVPTCTRIGSTTEGIFSSTLDKTLPNGWEYELSNEVYEDLNGKNYEGQGISADKALDYSTDKDIFYDQLSDQVERKRDEAIEMALALDSAETGWRPTLSR